MEIRVIDNKERADSIRKAIKANDGYCPCMIEKKPSTKCICEDFMENTKAGEHCHCGLYLKVKE